MLCFPGATSMMVYWPGDSEAAGVPSTLNGKWKDTSH